MSESITGSILAAMLYNIWECIYCPDRVSELFLEYDSEIYSTFTGSYFWTLFAVLKGAGIALLVTTCLISLMDRVSDGDFTIENLFRHLLKYFMLYVILTNLLPMFRYMLKLADAVVNDMSGILDTESESLTVSVSQTWLANSLNNNIGVTSKISWFLMAVIPYFASVLYTVILTFLATSRLLETVVRLAVAPITVGIAGLSHGRRSEAVRYLKHTAGILFQIVVIMAVSSSVTITHDALVTGGNLENPASVLEPETGFREIDIENDDNWRPAVSGYGSSSTQDMLAYTKASTVTFAEALLDPDDYFTGAGLMVAAVFLLFKSRSISAQMFD